MLILTSTMTGLMAVFMFLNARNQDGYTFADVAKISLPFVVFLWVATLLIILGPSSYGGHNLLSNEVFYAIYIVVAIYAFYFFTNKKFVAKCQAIRTTDNTLIVE